MEYIIYKENYKVYRDGRVWSDFSNKWLSIKKCKGGYCRVQISRKYYWLVHRLVATLFIPNPHNKLEVNHINSIKDDNRVENLEWVTSSENQKHAYTYGNRNAVGSNNGNTKLKNADVIEIRKRNHSISALAKMYNVSERSINNILYRKTWKHI